MSNFILIFALIVISGLIAVAGDWVGLRTGKKELLYLDYVHTILPYLLPSLLVY